MKEKEIKEIIRSVIKKWTGVEIHDDNKMLIDYKIHTEDYLYVILELEDTYNLPILSFIKENDGQMFTLENLGKWLKCDENRNY